MEDLNFIFSLINTLTLINFLNLFFINQTHKIHVICSLIYILKSLKKVDSKNQFIRRSLEYSLCSILDLFSASFT